MPRIIHTYLRAARVRHWYSSESLEKWRRSRISALKWSVAVIIIYPLFLLTYYARLHGASRGVLRNSSSSVPFSRILDTSLRICLSVIRDMLDISSVPYPYLRYCLIRSVSVFMARTRIIFLLRFLLQCLLLDCSALIFPKLEPILLARYTR